MTTLPQSLLSEQEIRDAMPDVEQTCVGTSPGFDTNVYTFRWPHIEQLAHNLAGKLLAKLAQGVELEAFWYVVVSESAPAINKAIRSLEAAHEYADKCSENWSDVQVLPLYTHATAQAAVAAAILQERDALNDETADMVVRLQDEKEAAVAAERLKTEKAQALHKQACEAYARKNRSGCCCTISEDGEGDEVVKPCAMHQAWRDEAVAAASPAPAAEPVRPAGWDNQWDQFRPPLGDVVKRLRARRGLGSLGLEFVNDIGQLLAACESALEWNAPAAEPAPIPRQFRCVTKGASDYCYHCGNEPGGAHHICSFHRNSIPDDMVAAFGCSQEADDIKYGDNYGGPLGRCKKWCKGHMCPVSLRSDGVATPSPLPAAAGVEERAGLAKAVHKAVSAACGKWSDVRSHSTGETIVSRCDEAHAAEAEAHAAIDRLASAPAQVPEGMALVPLRMNAEMQRVSREDGWQWEDLLAAAGCTEEQCNAASEEPAQVADVPNSPCAACDGDGRVPSPEECTRCGLRGCWTVECAACGGTGEVAAGPAAGGV